MDKVLAVEKYRAQYLKYLQEYALAANRLFVFSDYEAKFDQLFAPYGDKCSARA